MSTMKYDSNDVAKYIMYYCQEKGFKYNNTKIQKLLFAVHGTLMAQNGKSMINETPRMWPYGPVFVNVFQSIKLFGLTPENLDFKNEMVKQYVDETIEFFAKYSASALTSWSHQKGTPWYITKEANGEAWNTEISDSITKEYFESVLSDE